MRTVKNSKMYLLIAPEREEISQKFQRIWILQAKTIFSMQNVTILFVTFHVYGP
jgi:hypothetical protein